MHLYDGMPTDKWAWRLATIYCDECRQRAFFAATYIPKEARFGRIGMRQLIPGITGMWNNEPERIQKQLLKSKKDSGKHRNLNTDTFPVPKPSIMPLNNLPKVLMKLMVDLVQHQNFRHRIILCF